MSKFGRPVSPNGWGNDYTGWLPPEYSGGTTIILTTRYPAEDDVNFPIRPRITTVTPVNPNNPMTTNNTPVCNCLAGTPVILANGSCGCTQPTDPTDEGQLNVIDTNNNGQPVIYTVKTDNGTTQAGLVDTLKAKLQNNPTAALVGAGILAYLIFKGGK